MSKDTKPRKPRHQNHWLLAGQLVLPPCSHLRAPGLPCLSGSAREEKGREDNPPRAPLQPYLGRQRCKSNMPHDLWPSQTACRTFKCLTHVWKGLLHDCSICRVCRFNLLCPPHALVTGCGCSWVSHGAFTTHDGKLGAFGPVHAENTPWRSRLQGVIQCFHVVAVIKRLLESRERWIPPMDSSGL